MSDLSNNLTTEEKIDIVGAKSLSEAELFRGATPENLKEKCLQLCQQFLAGSWAHATSTSDIVVSRITGGLTNQLYKVQLSHSVAKSENPVYADEPSVVAIKLYETKHISHHHPEDESQRLNDSIVLTIFGQTGLGPKIYGIFEGGFIQAFHENEQYGPKFQQNSKLIADIATILAQVHNLNVPIHKANYFFKQLREWIDTGYKLNNVPELAKEMNLSTLLKHDLKEEFTHFEALFQSITSTPVFTHGDLRCMNILVTKPEEKILLVDVEYSSYYCRSYDIATFIMEWGHERFDFANMGIPEPSVLERFIQLYIDACEDLNPGYSAKPENSLPVIVHETKLFILSQYMMFTAFAIKAEASWRPEIPFDAKTNMKQVEASYAKYYSIKRQLIDEGVIKQ